MTTGHLEDRRDFLESKSHSRLSHQDLEDMFSLNSASPCLTEDVQDTKLPEKQGVLAHLHHVSPLESIRELAEMEDACERRSPGDGEFRFKGPRDQRIVISESLTIKEHGDTWEEAVDSNARSLESLRMEACPEDASNLISQPVKWSSFDDKVTGDHLTSSDASSAILDVQLDHQSSATPLPNHKEDANDVGARAKVDEESDSDDQPNSNGEPQCDKEVPVTPDAADQTLIEILTACESKVEQLEKLKSSSFQLSNQLHCAQALAARLHHRVLHLERECRLKEKQLHDLTAKLETTSRALRERNSDMAALTEELHRLELEADVKQNVPAAARTVSVNGQVGSNAHTYNNGTSRVCTLL